MKYLIKILKAYLTKAFSDLHNITLGIIAGMIVGSGSLYLFSKKLWIILENIAQSNTPLWATATLILLALEYTHIRLKNQLNSQNTSVKPKIDFIENGDLKWKVRLYPDGKFNIDETPFCIKHDMKLHHFFSEGIYVCYHIGKKDCDSKIEDKTYRFQKEYIESLAEQKYRNT